MLKEAVSHLIFVDRLISKPLPTLAAIGLNLTFSEC